MRHLRGKPFYHSGVDGILGRLHYRGNYPDKTADDDGIVPEREDWIWIECPRIIEPEEAEEVAARRAKAAPARTAPRITNGPTLVTGRAVCGMPDCGKGLTIQTGKGGRYSYYSCAAKGNGAAARCSCEGIREEQLDAVVLDVLASRVLEPEHLRSLLAHVLEKSDEANDRRSKDLQQARAERPRAESAINKLLELIETGVMSPRDPVFAKRIWDQRARIGTLNTTIESLERQMQRRAPDHARGDRPVRRNLFKNNLNADGSAKREPRKSAGAEHWHNPVLKTGHRDKRACG